ncbi:MAG: glycosyltransferase family 61 protein [Verrucomicrobiota bacterium JB024]|nr:glycosyltransferase family 61 protein [Verrucomicrobiota bacterium JB024]
MIEIERQLPVNLDPTDRGLFESYLHHRLPEPKLNRYHGVRATGMGILIKGLSLLPESFPDTLESKEWSWESNKYNQPLTKLKLIAKSHLPGRTEPLGEPALWFTDTWSLSYFFWLSETLARLEFIRPQVEAGWPVVMPGHYLEVDFVKTTLELFGINNLVPVPIGRNRRLREVHIPTRTAGIHHFNPELVRRVGERFRAVAPPCPACIGKKLHISRRKARVRKFVNEDAVEAVFEKFGYTTVCMEDYGFREQVGMLCQARALASIHGAGLTNILMMAPGAAVFELRMRGPLNCSFFNLASACGHPYFYQTCEPEKPDVHEQQNNFIADIDLLTRNLEQIERHLEQA